MATITVALTLYPRMPHAVHVVGTLIERLRHAGLTPDAYEVTPLAPLQNGPDLEQVVFVRFDAPDYFRVEHAVRFLPAEFPALRSLTLTIAPLQGNPVITTFALDRRTGEVARVENTLDLESLGIKPAQPTGASEYPAPEQRVRDFLDGIRANTGNGDIAFAFGRPLTVTDLRDVLAELDAYRTAAEGE